MAIDKILIPLDQLGSFACIFKESHDSFAIHTWSIILWKLTYMGPQGFWGSGENGYLFSGSWEALVIILGELGSKLKVLGI